jgi:hypothetical protein
MSEVEGKPDVAPRWLELLFLAKGIGLDKDNSALSR